jgi:hypothetical protein
MYWTASSHLQELTVIDADILDGSSYLQELMVFDTNILDSSSIRKTAHPALTALALEVGSLNALALVPAL